MQRSGPDSLQAREAWKFTNHMTRVGGRTQVLYLSRRRGQVHRTLGTCHAHASRIRLTAKAPLSIRATINWSGSTANLPTTRNILSAPNQQSEDFHAQRRPSGQGREIARTFCGTSRRVGRRVGTVGNGRWGGERRRRGLRGWLGWLAGLAGWADEWIDGWVPAGTRSVSTMVSNSSATASVAKRTHLCV